MNVIFAPDWRSGVPYQRLLAEALEGEGIHVDFLQGYRRVMPLARLLRPLPDGEILHLHWPEAYCARMHDGWDWFRNSRFALDLALATRRHPLVLTAHNLHAHNRAHERLSHFNNRSAFQRARLIVAHSEVAQAQVIDTYAVSPRKVRVIPHGDLSIPLGAPLPRSEARAAAGFGPGAICLMFGMAEPYKGMEEIIDFWKARRPPARLVIAGKPLTPEYGAALAERAAGGDIQMRLGWMADSELLQMLSAVDCVIFNYRTIFTSGAACLARALGIPLLLPARLRAFDLAEPSDRVFRFESCESDFELRLAQALVVAPNYESAAPYRAATAWSKIAKLTAEAYHTATAVS